MALKRDPFQFLLNSQEWLLKKKKWILRQTEGLELVEHIIGLWKAVLESSFFFSDLTLNPQLKCVTKLVWIGTSAGLMTRRYFGDRRKKLIGSKEVEHFLKAQVAFLSWKLYFFRDENWTVSPESSDLHEGLSRHDFVFEVCVCVCTKHKSVCLHTSACWILFFLLLPRSCHSTGFEADL